MCRFFAVSSATPLALAAAHPDLNQFRHLAQLHGDGWGIGTLDEIRKEPVSALDDDAFAAAASELTATDLVLHLRRASCTLHNRRCDTHPWAADTAHGPMVFAHNGHIFGLPLLDRLVAEHVDDPPFCHTDSGRFLNLAAALLSSRSIPDALIEAVRLVENVTTHVALNCVLLSRAGLWVMQAANPTMDDWPVSDPPRLQNFTLQQRVTPDYTVVASNGWEPSTTGWEPFNNREIRHYQHGKLVNVIELPEWSPGFDPVPDEELLVNPGA